ncbi:unnamed protein product [Acanthoscelides obtectus]|uniref:CCDC66 domain-containing protein n=1 Tax=Acanthoscelides obtectus TaxID=200917 RepID=A0A9P0KGW0_ACAOB|nr:unnamed protein product [Acanthoscelides obtectus]CAK1660549.1 hypothetical protein AOBTE_LOCUS22142 [Acanthoscelides obtectus]
MYRNMSLVERKKLQWAKEKEEMAALCSPLSAVKSIERLDNKLAVINQEYRKDPRITPRRSSLPPLYKNNCLEKEKEIGGETSGYGSDHSPGCVETWQQSGYESSSSRDDRPKWQGREEPFDKAASEPPNWVKRGLQDGEIIVSNTSPAESPEQRCEDSERPYTSSTSCSQQRNTFIRGQNVRIDSAELAERERRRQIAIAHQEAIRRQLEERERSRKEERERKIKEEMEEELRIKREQEIEKQKREAELKSIQEKQEKDRKRKEAIQEAIELAQKEAQQERLKRNRNVNLLDNCSEKNLPKEVPEYRPDEFVDNNDNLSESNNSKQGSSAPEMLNNELSSLEVKGKSMSTPRSSREDQSQSNTSDQQQPKEQLNNQQPFALTQNNTLSVSNPDNLALVLPPLESLHTYQYALLVPTTPQTLPIAVPININSARSDQRTENRLLTPTQYRNKNKRLCDSATQTDDSYFRDVANNEKYLREKLTNLELSYENRNRKGRRSRSESLEDRPKWGANRPPTRYVKQSEKDPLYQRRKLRQKMRETKNYEDKNSSDDSRTASPRYRKKDKRTQRPLWRRNDQMFTRNIRMMKTEIIPLESDRDQLYYKNSACYCGRHRCSQENVRVDILKIERSPRETSCREDQRERLPDVNDDIIDKLSCLHNGLMMKSEQWENNSQSSLSSATRR